MNPEILGTILTAKDGILYIFGLSSVKQSELLQIDKKRKYTQLRKFESYLEDRLKQEESFTIFTILVHSFQYSITGRVNSGICPELCGENHARMPINIQ